MKKYGELLYLYFKTIQEQYLYDKLVSCSCTINCPQESLYLCLNRTKARVVGAGVFPTGSMHYSAIWYT